MVTAVYAPDSSKSLEMYEGFMSSVVEVLLEGRRGGPKTSTLQEMLMCSWEYDVYSRQGHRGSEGTTVVQEASRN